MEEVKFQLYIKININHKEGTGKDRKTCKGMAY